jgi:hypothetical protein
MDAAGLEAEGAVPWGVPVPCRKPGVYVVSLDQHPDGSGAALERAPISSAAVDELLQRRPALTIDSNRPARDELAERLRGFWLPDEVVLYIGLAGTAVAERVDAYYKTPLGARSPHAGGWFLKTLSPRPPRWVHWASSDDPSASEDAMLRRFCASVTRASRRLLLDPSHPFPFANLEWPPGVRKRHGISGARASRTRVESRPPLGEPALEGQQRGRTAGSSTRFPSSSSEGLTLHEAMVAVLNGVGWLTFREVADQIKVRDLYRRRDGLFAQPGQLRLRATKSGGSYSHLFDVDGPRIRLRVEGK